MIAESAKAGACAIIGVGRMGIWTNAYAYACRDCEGMEACPASVVAESKEEVWKLMELHARVAHDEDPADWDQATRDYLGTLIKPVTV